MFSQSKYYKLSQFQLATECMLSFIFVLFIFGKLLFKALVEEFKLGLNNILLSGFYICFSNILFF